VDFPGHRSDDFGGLFLTYTVYRLQYPAEFAEASKRLNIVYGGVNTVVLLTSSLTMALAVHAVQAGQRGTARSCLGGDGGAGDRLFGDQGL